MRLIHFLPFFIYLLIHSTNDHSYIYIYYNIPISAEFELPIPYQMIAIAIYIIRQIYLWLHEYIHSFYPIIHWFTHLMIQYSLRLHYDCFWYYYFKILFLLILIFLNLILILMYKFHFLFKYFIFIYTYWNSFIFKKPTPKNFFTNLISKSPIFNHISFINPLQFFQIFITSNPIHYLYIIYIMLILSLDGNFHIKNFIIFIV